jgi:hypothetical protein
MLTVRLYDRVGGECQVIEARALLVETEHGDPIMLGLESGAENVLVVAHIQDPDFQRLLHALGFDRTLIVDVLPTQPLPPGAQLLQLPFGQ